MRDTKDVIKLTLLAIATLMSLLNSALLVNWEVRAFRFSRGMREFSGKLAQEFSPENMPIPDFNLMDEPPLPLLDPLAGLEQLQQLQDAPGDVNGQSQLGIKD